MLSLAVETGFWIGTFLSVDDSVFGDATAAAESDAEPDVVSTLTRLASGSSASSPLTTVP